MGSMAMGFGPPTAQAKGSERDSRVVTCLNQHLLNNLHFFELLKSLLVKPASLCLFETRGFLAVASNPNQPRPVG